MTGLNVEIETGQTWVEASADGGGASENSDNNTGGRMAATENQLSQQEMVANGCQLGQIKMAAT